MSSLIQYKWPDVKAVETGEAPKSFIRAVRGHMTRLGLSVSDLAVILDVSQGTVYKWLRGEAPRSLTQQAVLYRLDQQRDYRYNAKEIEAALRNYRKVQ